MKITRCTTCDKPLALNDTAWSCGPMFCSCKCGVDWAKTKYEESEYTDDNDLTAKATAYFNDIAEEISREDYGAYEEVWTAYDATTDVTTIFHSVGESDTRLSTRVTGWYHGEPNERDTKQFDGELEARYDD